MLTKPSLGRLLNRGHPLAYGLAGFWLFNEGAGFVGDSTGANPAGVPPAVDTWVAGAAGPSLSFPGSGAPGFSVGSAWATQFSGKSSLTIVARVATNSTAATNQTIYRNDTANGDAGFGLILNGGGIEPYVRTSGGINFFVTSAVLTAGAWAVVGMRYDGSALTAWLNGRQVQSAAASGTITIVSRAAVIGAYGTSTGQQPFSGSLDSLGLWTRAMPDADMRALAADPYQLFARPRRVYSVRSSGLLLKRRRAFLAA